MDFLSVYHDDIPVFLLACAQTPAMQRLRGVGMSCGCEYTGFPRFCNANTYSRYEHSLGVALIVWHFTHDPAQALAGLFHDISTPVFAHVIDFLKGDSLRQEATEAGTMAAIAQSPEICAILDEMGLTAADVGDYHRYPIADNRAPMLSADRLEYNLKDSIAYGFWDCDAAAACYRDLTVVTNAHGAPELAFRTEALAVQFAMAALTCGRVYASAEDRYAMQLLSEQIQAAMESHVLCEADLHTTEAAVIQKLMLSPGTRERWQAYRALSSVRVSDAPLADGLWRKISTKKRYVNPLTVHSGRVGAFSPVFREALADFLSEPQDNWVSY